MTKKILMAIGIAALIGAAVFFLKSGFRPSADAINTAGIDATDGSGANSAGSAAAGKSGTAGDSAAVDAAAKSASGAPGTATLPPTALEEAQDKAYLSAPPLSAKEIKSVKTLMGTMMKYDRGKAELNQFIKYLTEAGLDPLMAKDENPYTGKMLVIRTKEALEGTRYMHAQYFEDDENHKEPFRQHISFEIRPSPDGMEQARKILESMGGKELGQPKRAPTDGWVEWEVDGYSYWIHRLERKDIADHPFNARTVEDIGAVEVAKEVVPGGHDEEEH